MTIINQLKAQDNFNGSEKDLANYILKNKEDVLNLSIQKLATNTFSSTSTVVRLCRKIGLKGFKDFKIKLSAELQKHYDDISTIDPDFPFTEDDSNKEIAQKIANVMETSIKQTSELLDNSTLEKAIRLILKAKHLGIFAYGDTYISALSFQNKLMKINFHAQLPTLVEESNFLAANFQKDDCALVISYSGQTKSTYQMTKILRLNGCCIIAITADENSKIAQLSDLVVPVNDSENSTEKISPFASSVAIDYVLNTLYSGLFVANYDNNQRHRLASEKLFSDSRFSEQKK